MILENGHPYSPLVASYIVQDGISFMNAVALSHVPHELQDKLCDFARTLDYKSFRNKVRNARYRYYAKRAQIVKSHIKQAFDAEHRWTGSIPNGEEMQQDEARINVAKEVVNDYITELETFII